MRLPRWTKPMTEARGLSKWILIAGIVIVAFFVFVAIFAPMIAPYGFDQVADSAGRFPKQAPPDSAHLLGTTVQSTDVLSRIIWGARTAIEVVVVAVVLSILVGVPLGLISGYVGGRLDRVLVLIMDALFAFPYILLAIVIAFLLSDSIGQGIFSAAIAITVVYIPQYFRVVRNHVISVREEPLRWILLFEAIALGREDRSRQGAGCLTSDRFHGSGGEVCVRSAGESDRSTDLCV